MRRVPPPIPEVDQFILARRNRPELHDEAHLHDHRIARWCSTSRGSAWIGLADPRYDVIPDTSSGGGGSPTTGGDPLVKLDGVGVRIGSTQILRDVDLEISAGEVVGLFGANGAGKTTALRLMATLIRPSQGTGTVLGADLTSQERYDVRRRIGMIGHTPGIFPELTLGENLRYAARVAGVPPERADEALVAVGLGGAIDRRAGASSHGMQRRTEFARELMIDRSLLLLDEPHSALDRDAVDLVEGLIARTAEEGGAVVVVSHDRDRINKIASRSVEIQGGTLS